MTRTLFIAGDSTAAIKGAGEKPMTGWGEYLQGYFESSILHVKNCAINGRSTKSFIADGRLDAIKKDFQVGDYLFIQFGHNDEKKEDPTRYTDPDTEYRRNLILFIEAARQLGGTPVLLTSVSRRRFLSNGVLDPLAVGSYPEVMRQVAEETQTTLLDIFAASQQLYHRLGEEDSKKLFMHLPEKEQPNYPNGVTDDTHFSDEGARQIVRLVVESIKQSTDLHISDLQQLKRSDRMSIPLHLGVRAHDFEQIPLKNLIEKLQNYKFSHIQFALRKSFPESAPNLAAISPGTASYFGNAFRKAGIQIAVLGCYVNIVDTDPLRRAQALTDFGTHLRLARDFGASLVGTETGSVGQGYTTNNFTEDAFHEVVISVKAMVAEAERFGVTVGIEAGNNHPLCSAPLTRRLLDAIPSNNLQVILDCANLMSSTNYMQQEVIIAEALELLGDRIAVIHLKDFIVKDEVIHIVPVGLGLLNFEPILRYMKYERPHIQGILESTTEPYMKESIAYLERIYEEV